MSRLLSHYLPSFRDEAAVNLLSLRVRVERHEPPPALQFTKHSAMLVINAEHMFQATLWVALPARRTVSMLGKNTVKDYLIQRWSFLTVLLFHNVLPESANIKKTILSPQQCQVPKCTANYGTTRTAAPCHPPPCNSLTCWYFFPQ